MAPENRLSRTLRGKADDARLAENLVRRFAELIGRCGVRSDAVPANPSAVLETWLKDALSCGIPAVETFAAGVRQDETAVKAALTMPWSSGQAGGRSTS